MPEVKRDAQTEREQTCPSSAVLSIRALSGLDDAHAH